MPDYIINTRPYTINTLLDEENSNGLYDLSYLSLINIEGDRAGEFLQGQVSCDVNQVTRDQMRQGLFCNLQGRIQAMVDVINYQGFQLVLPADLIPSMLTILAKTAMVSRVKVKAHAGAHVYGLYIPNPDASLPLDITLPSLPFSAIHTADTYCYALGDHCYILISNTALANQPLRGSLAWHRLQLSLGRVEIYPDTQAMFLPHRLDLHKKNYISFDKGCYKGQEIIARTHYRAKLKHGLQQFLIDTEEPLLAGSKVFSLDKGTEIGELIDFCPVSARHMMISVSILNEHPESVQIEGQQNNTRLICGTK